MLAPPEGGLFRLNGASLRYPHPRVGFSAPTGRLCGTLRRKKFRSATLPPTAKAPPAPFLPPLPIEPASPWAGLWARLGLGRLCRLTAGLRWGPSWRSPQTAHRGRTPRPSRSTDTFPPCGRKSGHRAVHGPTWAVTWRKGQQGRCFWHRQNRHYRHGGVPQAASRCSCAPPP